jgi:hypothetical protein
MSTMWSRRPVIIAAAAAALALMVTGTAVALTTPASAHVASVAMPGHGQAALKIVTGTTVLDVSMARLPGTLLRVSTPDGAPVRPVLSGSAPIVLSLVGSASSSGSASSGGGASSGGRGAYAVSVVLSSSVVWSLDFAGGTQRIQADLRDGRVGGIAVTAGSDILQMSLPRPAGTLPFLLAGGVTQFQLSLPGGVPARVTVGGGAAYVSVDDQQLTGVAGGTVLTPPGWAGATSRFDIDATAGFSRLTVSRWAT